jgi:HSP20 family molecular chaperone IbpA
MNRNISRYNPIPTLRDPFAQMDELLRDFAISPFGRGIETEPRIRMDVEEKDDAYVIKADIPGVNKEDIKVDVEGNTVTIAAECRRDSGTTSRPTWCAASATTAAPTAPSRCRRMSTTAAPWPIMKTACCT